MPAPVTGGRRRGASVKTLKRALKKAGLKTTGKKAALTRRAKKAGLHMKGGIWPFDSAPARKKKCSWPGAAGHNYECSESCPPGSTFEGYC